MDRPWEGSVWSTTSRARQPPPLRAMGSGGPGLQSGLRRYLISDNRAKEYQRFLSPNLWTLIAARGLNEARSRLTRGSEGSRAVTARLLVSCCALAHCWCVRRPPASRGRLLLVFMQLLRPGGSNLRQRRPPGGRVAADVSVRAQDGLPRPINGETATPWPVLGTGTAQRLSVH